MSISARIEDYLEAILEIELGGDIPSVTALAENLGVRKATVVAAVKKMKESGALVHERYGGIDLTDSGRKRALKIYRRHQHLAFIFKEIIGLDSRIANEVACSMEHYLDPESEKRLSSFVDFYCQSLAEKREWIVKLSEKMDNPEDLSIPVGMLEEGDSVRVVRMTGSESRRRFLIDQGIVPEAVLSFVSKDGSEEDIIVEVDGRRLGLSFREAMMVWGVPLVREDGGNRDEREAEVPGGLSRR